jgi:hypothetical protein
LPNFAYAEYVETLGFEDGFRLDGNARMFRCYAHDNYDGKNAGGVATQAPHSDSVQALSAAGWECEESVLDCFTLHADGTRTPGNACFQLGDATGPVQGFHLWNGYFDGGGYKINCNKTAQATYGPYVGTINDNEHGVGSYYGEVANLGGTSVTVDDYFAVAGSWTTGNGHPFTTTAGQRIH